MGENWVICPDRMPGNAVQRTKDGAAAWNYEHFQFTFDPEACLSNGAFGILNSVNQIDFGRLSEGILANTNFGTFQIPVDSSEETPGGGRMVI
jgi:hypothetical protein